MKIMEAKPCQEIKEFAAEMVMAAYDANDLVLGEFNQHTLEARPGSTRDDVIRQWSLATHSQGGF